MRAAALVAAAVLASGCVATVATTPSPPPGPLTLDVFEGSLAPYGEWIVLPGYGRAWRPTQVRIGWRPYLYGEWVWTEEGWFWATDEPWGWATFHYGRWLFDPTSGWVWIPGFTWGPAWVAWRAGDGLVGWAPLPPGADVWWTDAFLPDPAWWLFVPEDRFVGVPAEQVIVAPQRLPAIFPRTRPAPPRRIVAGPAPPHGGPSPLEIEQRFRQPVRPARIVPVPTPDQARGRGDRDRVRTFRPAPAPGPSDPARPPAAPPPPPPPRREGERGGP
jgi:hypothetical protein